jgi:hypothetical protein
VHFPEEQLNFSQQLYCPPVGVGTQNPPSFTQNVDGDALGDVLGLELEFDT